MYALLNQISWTCENGIQFNMNTASVVNLKKRDRDRHLINKIAKELRLIQNVSLYGDLDCQDIHINLEHPVITNGSEKRLIELLAVEAAPKYIANGITTQAEMDNVIREIKQWAERHDSYFGCARLTQVWTIRGDNDR